MRLLFNLKNREILEIQLKKGSHIVNETYLTVGQGFDILLIRTLDKILDKNKIDKLCLKNVEIGGKITPQAVSGMMLKTLAKALQI